MSTVKSQFRQPTWLLAFKSLWSLWLITIVCDGQEAPAADRLRYNRDVRPILSEKCFACHGFDSAKRQGNLRLDTREGALAVADSGEVAVRSGDPSHSELIHRILAVDAGELMPPAESGKSLSIEQKEILQAWIEQGAEYEAHWAFSSPQKSALPVAHAEPGRLLHPIDAFILERLRQAQVSASPPADAVTLIRRLSLDLLGLPPTIAELDNFEYAFQRDPTQAYTDLVDRLLGSPHYGERWGRWWLDQARYADSNGYSVDAPRQIWKYRDWVVDALNRDLPFDQFTIEQLAGDLLHDATDEQRVATGFHRNTQINQEGGIDPEQFRIDSVFDRVATTGTVWLGLTIGCAQCHDHKFDPIEQKEYFQFFAFFNNQEEPSLTLYPPQVNVTASTSERKSVESDKLRDAGVSTLVMKELSQPRKTTVFVQGDFTRPAEEVRCGTPAVLPSLQATDQPLTRLDLARWITSPENPLTARVIVNRVWQHYFGRGLVETENDFGFQGSLPSHPELLDWLAVDFMKRGWRLKDLHRFIVTSQTYQQASVVRAELKEKDPDNYLLARQNRLRLEAEIVRDVGLAASGLLVAKMGGAPVYPPIPDGVMGQGQVKREWKVSVGDDRYRRGLYTFLYRATPPPALSVFDAPDGFSTCTRRLRSNTPLQALTLMNDAAFFEFAVALEKVIAQDGIDSAFRRCVGRRPAPQELRVLEGLAGLAAARVLLNLDETVTRE